MRHRTKVLALLLVGALTLIACGSRVVPLSEGTGGLGGGTPLDGSVDPGDGGSTAPESGSTADGGTAPGATVIIPPVVPKELQSCRGGATDVGVTPTTVKLGLVASLTGPLPGQFNASVEAADSYVKMINDAGGICGRKFQLLIRDDSGDGKTNFAVATKLADQDKIFAFVGSTSAPDDSGIAKVSKAQKIPDIGFPLTWTRSESPYTFGVPGQVQRRWIGEGASGSKYLNKAHGIKQIAIFWLRESEVSILSAWGFQAAMMRATNGGIEVCHEQPAGVLDNNYTTYVVRMAGKCDPDKGPIAVYSTMENNANIKLALAMKDQGFKPTVFAPTFSSYLPSFISQSSGATEGAFIAMPQIPFERLSLSRAYWTPGTAELQRYLTMLKRYHPRHVQPGSFGGPGWGAAALFFDGVKACGAALTRACILDHLESAPPFSANGFVSPTRPGDHKIYTTDLIVQVRNGKFVEIRPQDKSGPPGAPDFWDQSELFDWWAYYCSHKEFFINRAEKDKFVKC